MPEYHNLQAYASFDAAGFDATLARYRTVLREIGALDGGTRAWLAGVRWNAAEGYATGGSPAAGVGIEAAGVRLHVRPHLIGFAAEGGEGGWMEYGLLFATESIERRMDDGSWAYADGLGPALWALMERFGRAFPEVGVFFTDEAQDGRPFEGWLASTDDRWRFDLARVSPAAAAGFAAAPAGYLRAEVDGALALAPRRAWTEAPWAP